ncbi:MULTISPECIES: sodium-dependent bicarbonate transport family permease [unclassified Cyanobium]|uniref:sodium-dependent bicarbonate transport family permease n=1 Tax=unclassified Cyanobium TaxID=2627006 RepID=UPI0020CF46D2|nr:MULTISPECIES: sodium-dependent bicarbonate transport family permease [unclassified Cyanobium]MCP9832959.1 sodium-dependent bicarbonate transport family permease [Cyanobium sp. La Preciosa 7G6]MCP9857996.1 sodium-dependent bicarbonate transport family permease [Cyanobium sp. Cruz-8H5]MCP9865389.1 sodium-dependent bicarbonate transport family permease [Cyanobium sp. Cruz-8D1]MCP9935709.1 sodium-dependent bicarbonate transport family permease [Cyanobium sp. Aljojuca 7A6]
MQSSLVLQNLLSAPVLFFFLGILGVLVGSDLEIPSPLPKLFSLYLLLAIGFKGGMELAHSGLGPQVLLTIGAAVLMSLLVPLTSFLFLRLRLDGYNAAAIAASYGSISAVTFITAESFLNVLEVNFDGFMVAALALMESPAIVVGVILARLSAPAEEAETAGEAEDGGGSLRWREILQEAFLNGSVYLLIGSLVIGYVVAAYSPAGLEKMDPFTEKLFYGALCFFLLDMGIVAAQRLRDLRQTGAFLIGFSLLAPPVHALVGLLVSVLLGLSQGNTLLFMVLCASASYIAVPAAMRMTVPQANPSLYISTALGLTFPFNVVVGIPLYMALTRHFIPVG